MIRRQFFILSLFLFISTVSGCAQSKKEQKKPKETSKEQTTMKEQKVLIETSLGNIVIKLYDETPLHRDNFVKLVKEGYYNDLLFHRVIANFMVQGGDPDSKDAPPGKALGQGGPGYTIDAEIVYPKLFHKKGALAAARTGDQINPEKKSSGSQFYIVQGKVYSEEEMEVMEQSIIHQKSQTIMLKYFEPHREAYMNLQKANDMEAMQKLQEQITQDASGEMAIIEAFKIPDEVKKAYTTVGGTPHLDDAYTVFGEVIEGLEIIDKIAAVKTGSQDRPAENVTMKMSIVE
ncbi:MAG: peptidylprolyl isomerase [Marinilabiliaceae bacterium]|nr:peptidylprolyl isomerase [Marinilabiliaceae bacterium]